MKSGPPRSLRDLAVTDPRHCDGYFPRHCDGYFPRHCDGYFPRHCEAEGRGNLRTGSIL